MRHWLSGVAWIAQGAVAGSASHRSAAAAAGPFVGSTKDGRDLFAGGILVLCAPLGAGLNVTRVREEPVAEAAPEHESPRIPVRA